MYDVDNFFERLTKLRSNNNISMRKMSFDLGQGESYIKEIEAKENFPSMNAFFNICDYFGIHPKDFFDDSVAYPKLITDILENLNKLNEEQLKCILTITRDLGK